MDMRVNSPAPPAGRHQPLRMASRVSIAEGALVLIVLYALVGAGIGAMAGSVLAGMLLGVFTGVCAVAAILLISGAALDGAMGGTVDGEPAVAPQRQMSSHR